MVTDFFFINCFFGGVRGVDNFQLLDCTASVFLRQGFAYPKIKIKKEELLQEVFFFHKLSFIFHCFIKNII